MTDVRAELTYTRNLGNFESVKVTVGVSDSLRNNEKVNEGFERVYSFVESKLIEKMEEIDADMESTPAKPTKKGKK